MKKYITIYYPLSKKHSDTMETWIITITYSFFAIVIYCSNLFEALNNNNLKKILLTLVLSYNILMIISIFIYSNEYNQIFGIMIFILSISTIMLISENTFKFFANILHAKLNWNRITHRILFPLSLYVLLYPFIAFNSESNLAIILNGIYDILNLLGFQIVMLMFSFVGIGFATRRTLKQSILRLNIKFPNLKYVILGVVAIFLIDYLVWGAMGIFGQLVGGDVAQKTVEESSNIENTIETIRRFAPSIPKLALISIVVGISEELLFRGALQPRFGKFYTSLLFASLHFQYLSVIALIEIFIISYVLGIIKEKTNTSTTAIIHMIYDFISLMGYAL